MSITFYNNNSPGAVLAVIRNKLGSTMHTIHYSSVRSTDVEQDLVVYDTRGKCRPLMKVIAKFSPSHRREIIQRLLWV